MIFQKKKGGGLNLLPIIVHKKPTFPISAAFTCFWLQRIMDYFLNRPLTGPELAALMQEGTRVKRGKDWDQKGRGDEVRHALYFLFNICTHTGIQGAMLNIPGNETHQSQKLLLHSKTAKCAKCL